MLRHIWRSSPGLSHVTLPEMCVRMSAGSAPAPAEVLAVYAEVFAASLPAAVPPSAASAALRADTLSMLPAFERSASELLDRPAAAAMMLPLRMSGSSEPVRSWQYMLANGRLCTTAPPAGVSGSDADETCRLLEAAASWTTCWTLLLDRRLVAPGSAAAGLPGGVQDLEKAAAWASFVRLVFTPASELISDPAAPCVAPVPGWFDTSHAARELPAGRLLVEPVEGDDRARSLQRASMLRLWPDGDVPVGRMEELWEVAGRI